MSKKLMLILIPVVALITFGGAFMAARITKPDPEPVPEPPSQETLAQQAELGITPNATTPLGQGQAQTRTFDRMMSDQQLRDLVREVRERIRDYETKLQGLEAQERRLQTAQKDVQAGIETLNALRVDVASAVAELKQQHEVLEQSRIRIRESEKTNLITVAKTLEKMTPDTASQLVANICQSAPSDPDVATEEVGETYAVKLLHLMVEKTRAKVFVALVELDPDLAGRLSMKLKRILVVK